MDDPVLCLSKYSSGIIWTMQKFYIVIDFRCSNAWKTNVAILSILVACNWRRETSVNKLGKCFYDRCSDQSNHHLEKDQVGLIWISWSDTHSRLLHRIPYSFIRVPDNAFRITLSIVGRCAVRTIQLTTITSSVPPTSLIICSTIGRAMTIIICIKSGEGSSWTNTIQGVMKTSRVSAQCDCIFTVGITNLEQWILSKMHGIIPISQINS